MEQEDEPSCLEKEKWVRIMPDYGAEGVWDRNGECCSVLSLPVKQDLRQRLLDWEEWYWDSDQQGEEELFFFDEDAFALEGRQIAHAVKRALPDWTVIYFDIEKCCWDMQQARCEFEYEILI